MGMCGMTWLKMTSSAAHLKALSMFSKDLKLLKVPQVITPHSLIFNQIIFYEKNMNQNSTPDFINNLLDSFRNSCNFLTLCYCIHVQKLLL